jgi:hypothetical protein
MSGQSSASVSCDLDVLLVGPADELVPVPVALEYDADDPYAVAATFGTGQGEGVRWVFARDLLARGIRDTVGDGDVRVWPAVSRGEDVVCIGLRSPDGAALLEAPAGAVADFVTTTYDLVPPGRESGLLNLDSAIDALLR